jgi:polyvinyl alcohol dehydrogenase (cytochrome)
MRKPNKYLFLLGALTSVLLLTGYKTFENMKSPNGWQSSGHNKTNSSFQSREHIINATNASQLAPKWVYNTDAAINQVNPDGSKVIINPLYPKSSVIVTPSVAKDNSAIYFGDINGRIHAVNAHTGQRIWVKSIVYDYLQKGAPIVDGVNVTPTSLIPAGTSLLGRNINIGNIYAYSRTTPMIYKNLLIIGLRPGTPTPLATFTNTPTISGIPTADTLAVLNRAMVIAVNKTTGALVWVTHGAPQTPLSQITTSLSHFQGRVFGGATNLLGESLDTVSLDSSGQNLGLLAANTAYKASGQASKLPNGNYTCCGGSGSAFALNAATGKLLWNTPTIDPTLTGPGGFGGYNGASVWGNNIPIDPARNSVFIATGNLHNGPNTLPAFVPRSASILPAGVHPESVLSLNMKTGAIQWSDRLLPENTVDVGSYACLLPFFYGLPESSTGCTDPLLSVDGFAMANQYTDTDFGQQPMLTEVNGKQVLIASQKSGVVYELDPSTGINMANFNNGLPVTDGTSSLYGGHEFGSATDGVGIYNQDTNAPNLLNSQLKNVALVNTITGVNDIPPGMPGGFFNKIDAATGKILWQTRDPNALILPPNYLLHASPFGAVTLANGVLYGTSLFHTLYAINAYNGQIVFKFTSGTIQGTNTPVTISGAGMAPPSIVNGTLYWPTGYAPITFSNSVSNMVDANDPFSPFDNQVIAFSVPKATGDLDNDATEEDDNLDIDRL